LQKARFDQEKPDGHDSTAGAKTRPCINLGADPRHSEEEGERDGC
jgi:hypothetical protein